MACKKCGKMKCSCGGMVKKAMGGMVTKPVSPGMKAMSKPAMKPRGFKKGGTVTTQSPAPTRRLLNSGIFGGYMDVRKNGTPGFAGGAPLNSGSSSSGGGKGSKQRPTVSPTPVGSDGATTKPTNPGMKADGMRAGISAFREAMQKWRDARPQRPEGATRGWGRSEAMQKWRDSRPSFPGREGRPERPRPQRPSQPSQNQQAQGTTGGGSAPVASAASPQPASSLKTPGTYNPETAGFKKGGMVGKRVKGKVRK